MIGFFPNTPSHSDRIGFIGLWLFSFSAFVSTAAAAIGYVLFALAFLLGKRPWRRLLSEPVVIASLGFGAYLLLHTCFAIARLPEISGDIWGAFRSWEKLLLFIPYAYWTGRRPEWLGRLLVAVLAGFLIGMLREVEWGSLGDFLGQRSGFQFPAIGFGLISGIMLLGLLILGWSSRETDIRLPLLRRIAWHLGWVLVVLIVVQGFIQSHSRGAWLALAVAFIVLAVVLFAARNRVARSYSKGSALTLVVLLMVGVMTVYALNHQTIQQRFIDESDVISGIIFGDREGERLSSAGLRLNVWEFGLDKLAENPFWGYGAGTTRHLISNSGLSSKLQEGSSWLHHMHSTYVDVLVQLGVVGLLWVLVIVYLLTKATRVQCRQGEMPGRYCLFFLAVLVFAAIWSLFDYRVVHREWRFAWIILAGVAYSFRLRALGFTVEPGSDGVSSEMR